MINNIEDLYKLAGSPAGLAHVLGVHQFTVERWRELGVPIKYWDFLIKKYNLTPAELYSITEKIRAKHAKS